MAKEIQLTKGQVAVVDDEDFEWLSRWKWQFGGGYAIRTVRNFESGQRAVKMHRELLCVRDPKKFVDHIDGNGLNNTRANLRECSASENGKNRKKASGKSSKYKGVSLCRNKYWRAVISVNGGQIDLGSYTDERYAAVVYNAAAIKYHGEFASVNEQEELNGIIPPTFKQPRSNSGYRGVHFDQKLKSFQAQLNVNKKRFRLKPFRTAEAAARAYDAKARELLGDKARLNFPDE